MKHLSLHRTLLFFSLLIIQLVTHSCKFDTKNEFNLEETRTLEKKTIIRLLDKAKSQVDNDDLNGAITTLDSIISNYGTYDEVEDAYALKEDAQNRYTINKILTLQNVDSLLTFIRGYNSEAINSKAKERIEILITTTSNPQILQDFLDSNQLSQLRPEAKRRQKELLEQKENNLFAEATQKNRAQTWKGFLVLYPEHPKKSQIEDKIIGLEVDEIFKGTYGEIPTSSQMGAANYVSSDMKITNSTPYTLTLRYSGPENKRLIISPSASQKVRLKSGDYRVTASVNASRVSNYAGRESLNGNYTSSYYISN
jgi:hypothetical protein